MKITDIEKTIAAKQQRVQELKNFSSSESITGEVENLEGEIKTLLSQLEDSKLSKDISAIDDSVPLKDTIEKAVKGETGIESQVADIANEGKKIAREVTQENSVELIKQKYQKLFAGLDEESFSDRQTKELIIEVKKTFGKALEDREKYDWVMDAKVRNITEVIDDEPGYIDLKKALVSDFPHTLRIRDLEKLVNQIAYADESFAESGEFRGIKKYLIEKSIKDGTLLKSIQQPAERYERIIPRENDKNNIFSWEEPTADDADLIKIDLVNITRNPAYIDEFSYEEKQGFRDLFIKSIASKENFPDATFTSPKGAKLGEWEQERTTELMTNAETVQVLAEKLGVSQESVQEGIFHGLLGNIKTGKLPEREYFESFPESKALLDSEINNPEKKNEIVQGLFDLGKKGKVGPKSWGEVSQFIGVTPAEHQAYLKHFADCSEKDDYYVENTVFGALEKNGGYHGALSPNDAAFVFENIPSAEKAKLISKKIDSEYSAERVSHLPFTPSEIEQGVIRRFSYRGVHTEMYDNHFNHVIKNVEGVFGVSFSKEDLKEKILKAQIFESSEKNIYSGSIIHHIEKNQLRFDAAEREQRKEEISQLYRELLKSGKSHGFRDAEKMADTFGPMESYITSAERYALIKDSFLAESKEGAKDLSDQFYDFEQASEFVPKEYKLTMLTDPDIQAKIGKVYEDYLERGNAWRSNTTSETIGFFISKTETYENAERSVFEKTANKNELSSLYSLFKKVSEQHAESSVIPKLKQHITENADEFIKKAENLRTLMRLDSQIPGSREKVIRHTEQALAALVPGSATSLEDIRNFFQIKYNPDDSDDYSYQYKFERYTRFYKETKSFAFFDKIESNYKVYTGGSWDGLYEKIGDFDETQAESHIAFLSFISNNRTLSWEEFTKVSQEKGLADFAQLGKVLDELRTTKEVIVSPDVVQSHFDKLIGLSPEDQKRKVIAKQAEEYIWRGLYQFAIETLQKTDIPQEEIMGAVFQQASSMLAAKRMYEVQKIWDSFPALKEQFSAESVHDLFINSAQAELNGSQNIENKEQKLKRLDNIRKAYWVTERLDRLPQSVQEKVQLFTERYGSKGTTLVSLAIAAYGLENENTFLGKLGQYEKVLETYRPENIPNGMGVSCGIEYEVGQSVGKLYQKESHLGYRTDMRMLNESADIKSGGAGGSAIHEIATRPTANPYVLLAEVKMLQDVGMLDFNFQKYPDASRGYHLSLGGDYGLNANSSDMRFIYNTLTMTGCAGLLVGKEVTYAKAIHSKSLESVGHKQSGERVEFKGMGGDSFEQFERTVLTAYHGGMASQIQNKYFNKLVTKHGDIDSEEYALSVPDTIEEFDTFMNLPESVAITDQEKHILFEWMRLKKGMIQAIKQHNESFIESEFYGSLLTTDGEYKELNLDDNYATKRQRYFGTEKVDIKREQSRYKIPMDVFGQLRPDSINAITRANNLLIFKEPVLSEDKLDENGRVKFNSNVYSFQTEMNAEGYQKGVGGTPFSSVFDRDGEMRDGYYPIQGTSEEMITHKSQIILNRFNKRMAELLKNPAAASSVSQQTNYETV